MKTNVIDQTIATNNVLRQEPINRETIVKDTVVREHIHPVQKEEIQEVIYREREQLEVHQVTQKMHETEVKPTLVEQRELAAEYRAPLIEKSAPLPENVILPTREVDSTLRTQVVHAPIINETVKKTVIEEVQPVLERDVFQPTTVISQQPIFEKIREAPVVVREVREVREIGTTTHAATPLPAATNPLIPNTQSQTVQPAALSTSGLVQQPLAQSLATPAPLVPGFVPANNNMGYEQQFRGYAPAQAGYTPVQPGFNPMMGLNQAQPMGYSQPLYNPADRGYTPPHALNHPVAQAHQSRGLTFNQGFAQPNRFEAQYGQQGLPVYNQPLAQNAGLPLQNQSFPQGYVPQQIPVGLNSYAAEGGLITSSQTIGQTGLVGGTGLISQKDLEMHNNNALTNQAPLQAGRM